MDPIVIIGTGLAGFNVLKELRKLDKETPVVMLTADDGRNYSKPMLSTGFTKGKEADELAQATSEAMIEQLNLDLRTYTTVTGIDTDA
ncbi:MAG: FAD-dependent oxidoreductase, partial [Alcanivoracaceae bacterium]